MTAPLPLLTEEEVHAVLKDVSDDDRSYGCLRCDVGVLPLRALDVDVRVVGTFAHTEVQQTFVNPTSSPVEATYIFPLPDRAAVTRFEMEVAGRRVEGVLQERGQARQTYDRAVRQGKRASIAEEERPGVFTLRVGNLMPGEQAKITLHLTGALPVVDGEVTYRFPLVVAPRYMPGANLDGDNVGDGTAADTHLVPDASRISPPVLLPGQKSPVQLSLRCRIDSLGLPLSQVRSALHAAWADEEEGLLTVSLGAGEKLNRDFIVRFRLGDAAMRQQAVGSTGGQADGADAFLLTVLPPLLNTTTTLPRDVVFVVDRSGSMDGWKMVAARRSVARMVDSLRANDRFAVLAFDTSVEHCPALGVGLASATDRNRFRAVEWLATVNDRGGTEMQAPLQMAADLLSHESEHRAARRAGRPPRTQRDRVLVFVTDGQVGNESQLLRALGNSLDGVRVFALGIDQAVNAGFLNRLSALGAGGEAELVESEDRVDEVLTRCHRRIDTPLLRDLSITLEGGTLRDDTIAPGRLPDVFAGVPAIVAGTFVRHRGGGTPTLIVRGTTADGRVVSERVPVRTSSNPALVPAWARLHLRDLEDRLDGNRGHRAELTAQILRVSLAAKVLCRFTAFVAVDHEVVNEGGRLQQHVQAVESPAGWGSKAESADMSKAMPPPQMAPGGMPPPSPVAPAPVGATRSRGFGAAVSNALGGAIGGLADKVKRKAAPMREEAKGHGFSAPMDDIDDEDSLMASEGGGASYDAIEIQPVPPEVMDQRLAAMDRLSKEAEAAAMPTYEPMPVAKAASPAKPASHDLSRSSEVSEPSELSELSELSEKSAKKASKPASKPAASARLVLTEALIHRLREILNALQSGDQAAIDDAIEALRLLIEGLAHDGTTPAQRRPLEDALRSLEARDRSAAIARLDTLLAA